MRKNRPTQERAIERFDAIFLLYKNRFISGELISEIATNISQTVKTLNTRDLISQIEYIFVYT